MSESNTEAVSDREIVTAVLAAAGVSPAQHDVDRLVAGYPMVRGMIDLMYTVQETRYEDMALVFQADPVLDDWA